MPPYPGRQAREFLGMLYARGNSCGQVLAYLNGHDGFLQVRDGENGIGQRSNQVVDTDPGRPIGIGQLAGLEEGEVLV